MKKNIKIVDFDKVLNWSYPLAREWAIENLVPLGVVSSRKFDQYKKSGKKLPLHFPRRPDDYFRSRGTWKGWDDFFGNPQHKFGKTYYNYETASKVTQKYGIKNSNQFRNWKERPEKIPSRPDLYYKEWKSWEEFLGTSYLVERKITYHKLSERDVKIIKHQLSLGVKGSLLAKHFRVSEMQISRIKNGLNWKEL